MAITRRVDPEVGHLRSKVAVSVLKGDDDAAARYRKELADARIIAAAKEVAARLPELPPEKLQAARAILLGGAA